MIRVSSEQGDARERIAGYVGKPGPGASRPRRRPSRPQLIAAGVVVAVLAAVLPFALRGHGKPSVASAVSVRSDSVAIVDAASGRVVGDVPVGAQPSAIAAGAGAVWVANATEGTVSRIDPSTRQVQTIQVTGTPVSLAVGLGAVWVVNADGRTVIQINPAANKVVDTISVGNGPEGVAVGAGGVWVANSLDDTVTRIDPQHGVVVPDIPVGPHPVAVVVEGQSVWVANSSDGTVMEIDPRSNAVTRTVHVGNGPAALGAGSGSIWVANGLDGTASRIDAGSGSVTATVPVGDGPAALAVAGASTWVTNQFGGNLSRIGPGGNVADTVRLGNSPQGVADVGGNLWVTVAASGTAHRGGTLLLESVEVPDYLDPALSYAPWAWQILAMTNDGLVGFRRVGGPDGATLVPDLADSVPAPTDGGRTYTFQLRPGIRYSNGQPVRASDFRNAIERGFRGHSPTAYYQGIVGADACMKDPATCDLSQGVVTDDASGKVTFHLSAPDAEFPYKLALPFADAVPLGTPDPTASTTVPATGPYEIQAYTPSHGKQEGTLVLVRNPQFHEWSAAAQPDGNPDRMVWTFGVGAEQIVTDVEQGHADVSLDSPPPDRLQEVTTRFTNQVHIYSKPWTTGIALNTNLPPFDDVRVRRAVNDAFDRGAAARASQPALPTCSSSHRTSRATDPTARTPSTRTQPERGRARICPGPSSSSPPLTPWGRR
jgi:YVTN family beta-propeller protein